MQSTHRKPLVVETVETVYELNNTLGFNFALMVVCRLKEMNALSEEDFDTVRRKLYREVTSYGSLPEVARLNEVIAMRARASRPVSTDEILSFFGKYIKRERPEIGTLSEECMAIYDRTSLASLVTIAALLIQLKVKVPYTARHRLSDVNLAHGPRVTILTFEVTNRNSFGFTL